MHGDTLSISDTIDVVRLCRPDVIVVQGTDSGGPGLALSAYYQRS